MSGEEMATRPQVENMLREAREADLSVEAFAAQLDRLTPRRKGRAGKASLPAWWLQLRARAIQVYREGDHGGRVSS